MSNDDDTTPTLQAELLAWKTAAGWSANGFGPQTPNEVAVFQREGERVNGQVTAVEIAKLRADLAFANDSLEAAHRNGKVNFESRRSLRGENEQLRAALARSLAWVRLTDIKPTEPGTYVVKETWVATSVRIMQLTSDGPDQYWKWVTHWLGPLPPTKDVAVAV